MIILNSLYGWKTTPALEINILCRRGLYKNIWKNHLWNTQSVVPYGIEPTRIGAVENGVVTA